MLFYIGVHAIDALLASSDNPQHPNTHDIRERYINPKGLFKKLNQNDYNAYKALYSLSIKARYMSEPGQTTFTKVSDGDVIKAIKMTDSLLCSISKQLKRTVSPVKIHCREMSNPSKFTHFKSVHEDLQIAS